MRYRSHLLTLAHDPESPFGVEVGKLVRFERSDFMPRGERAVKRGARMSQHEDKSLPTWVLIVGPLIVMALCLIAYIISVS